MPVKHRVLISLVILVIAQIHYSLPLLPYANQVHAQIQHPISVNAVVPPQQHDYQFAFVASDNKTSVAQNETLTYQITYGAYTSGEIPAPLTIVVDFSDDLAPNAAHVLDYVSGSASSGYNNTTPVVNLAARTITWTISSLPAGVTDQTLSFQLKTNENYTGTAAVTMQTRARMYNDYVAMPTQTIAQSYSFTTTPSSPPPNQAATTAPHPTVTLTPNNHPTPAIINLFFTDISPTTADLTVVTRQPSRQLLRYGTTIQNLSQTIEINQFKTIHQYHLRNLLPATTYYFQLIPFDKQENVQASEVFTFTTAKQQPQEVSQKRSVTISADNHILYSKILNGEENNQALLLLRSNLIYQLAYNFEQPVSGITVTAVVRDQSGTEQAVPLQQNNPFIGSLRTGKPGFYTLFIRLKDSADTVKEQQIAQIRVLSPLHVVDLNGNPIGDARLFFSVYNPKTKHYQPINPDLLYLNNPIFTDSFGQARIQLPAGMYRVRVTALGYNEKTVTFRLGKEPSEDFPTVILVANPLNLISIGLWIQDTIREVLTNLPWLFSSLFGSSKIFLIVGLGAVGSLICISIALFMIRTQIRWRDMLPFFVFHLFIFTKGHKERYLSGVILDEQKLPLGNVMIQAINPASDKVLGHSYTNTTGHFKIRNTFPQTVISLLCTKDGYMTLMVPVNTASHTEIKATLRQHQPITPQAHTLRHLAGSLFEVSLLLSLIMELCFFTTFGFMKTLPFFLITGITTLLWLFYLEEHERVL